MRNAKFLAKLRTADRYDRPELLEAMSQEEASSALWAGFRIGQWGGDDDEGVDEEQELLLEYPSAATADDWLVLLKSMHGRDRWHFVDGWGDEAERAIELALAHDRAAVIAARRDMRPSLAAQVSMVRARTGEPDALSQAAATMIAKAYLANSAPRDDDYPVRHADVIAPEKLARGVAKQLEKAPEVRNWRIVETVIDHLGPADRVRVAACYTGLDRRRRVLAALDGVTGARELLATEVTELDALRQSRGASLAAFALAYVCAKAGAPIPESLDPHLARHLLVTDSVDSEDLDLERTILRSLPRDRAVAVLTEHVAVRRVLAVAACVPDERVVRAMVAKLGDKYIPDQLPDAVGSFGAMAMPVIAATVEDAKAASKTIAGCATALGAIGTSDAAQALVGLLGHKSKVARDAATRALVNIGNVAAEAIGRGCAAKKKSIRDACEELTARLQANAANRATPLAALQQQLEALDAGVRRQIDEAPVIRSNHDGKASALVELALAHGPVVLVAAGDRIVDAMSSSCHSACLALFEMYDAIAGREYGRQPAENPSEAELAAAYAVVDLISRGPRLRSWDSRYFRTGGADRFGDWVAPAAALAVQSRPSHHAELLYKWAARDPAASRDALIAGLASNSKPGREVCVDGLTRLGSSAAAGVVLVLESKKKHARQAAARVLAALESPTAVPALESALDGERSEDVRIAMQDALVACRPQGTAPPPSSERAENSDTTPAVWESRLAEGRKTKPSKWIDPTSLPRLHFRDGTELSATGLAQLLARLKKEHERPDPLLWSMRPHLSDEHCAKFTAALYQQWIDRARAKAGDKWAVYQLALFMDDEVLHGRAPRLGYMASCGRHALAKWHIDVFVRHGSQAGRDWIAHWSDYALTDALRKHATEALTALAEAADGDTRFFMAGLNRFVAAEQAERNVWDLDFGTDDKRAFSYGKRSIAVHLTKECKLLVVDDKGKESKALPKAKRGDDKDAAARAADAFGRMVRELADIKPAVRARFEASMVSGRTWSATRFDEVVLQHALVVRLAAGIVFGTGSQTFTVSAEGTLCDVDGKGVTLERSDRISVVHPLELRKSALEGWRERVATMSPAPPFEQLSRPTFVAAQSTELPSEPMRPGTYVDRAQAAGWNRGTPEDAGMVYDDWIRMPARGITAQLGHSGYSVRDPGWGDELTLSELEFRSLTGELVEPTDVDPIAFSEARLAVEKVVKKPASKRAQPRPQAAATSGGFGMPAGYPSADLAPSNRAKCVQCDEKIVKGDIRVVIERDLVTPHFTGKANGYLHPSCTQSWASEAGLDFDAFRNELRNNVDDAVDALPSPL